MTTIINKQNKESTVVMSHWPAIKNNILMRRPNIETALVNDPCLLGISRNIFLVLAINLLAAGGETSLVFVYKKQLIF